MIDTAMEYAIEKHTGQVYPRKHKSWHYSEHLRCVARGFKRMHQWDDFDPTLLAAAWLHDVVEDTDATLGEIEDLFGPEITGVVDALTRRPNERYATYIERVKEDARATAIKLADLGCNMHHLLRPDAPPDKRSLLPRYLDAVKMLTEDW